MNVYCSYFMLWGAKLANSPATVSLALSRHSHQNHASYRLLPANGMTGVSMQATPINCWTPPKGDFRLSNSQQPGKTCLFLFKSLNFLYAPSFPFFPSQTSNFNCGLKVLSTCSYSLIFYHSQTLPQYMFGNLIPSLHLLLSGSKLTQEDCTLQKKALVKLKTNQWRFSSLRLRDKND